MTPDDWTAVALVALAESGVGAVAIEPLAARLGATKGSGYWHFANRAALVEATLARWEREYTERIITETELESSPARRLRHLFHTVLADNSAVSVEAALLANAADAAVRPVLRRVTARRIDYLVQLFAEMGFSNQDARWRARVAYTSYLGHADLVRADPGQLPSTSDRHDYIDAVLSILTAP